MVDGQARPCMGWCMGGGDVVVLWGVLFVAGEPPFVQGYQGYRDGYPNILGILEEVYILSGRHGDFSLDLFV